MITCHKCGTHNVAHYKQKRRDGVWVVTARCENGHIPEKGKPFYSIAAFELPALPVLPADEYEQPLLFVTISERPVMNTLDAKREAYKKFPPMRTL